MANADLVDALCEHEQPLLVSEVLLQLRLLHDPRYFLLLKLYSVQQSFLTVFQHLDLTGKLLHTCVKLRVLHLGCEVHFFSRLDLGRMLIQQGLNLEF